MQRHSAYASEGFWPFVAVGVGAIAIAKLVSPIYALLMLIPMVLLFLLFRDPQRDSPMLPLAALAPVDGRVTSVTRTRSGLLDREALRVVIRVNPFGAYTLRAPVEGKLLDPRDNDTEGSKLTGRSGLWIRTDEGDDVVVTFSGRGWIGVPKSFRRYGERVGHGHRCGFLRLAKTCQVYLPSDALPRVEAGDVVVAAVDPLAKLQHERAETEQRSSGRDRQPQSRGVRDEEKRADETPAVRDAESAAGDDDST